MLWSAQVKSQEIIPAGQWNSQTREWAVKAVVKERDFPVTTEEDPVQFVQDTKQEYAAILFVLRNRWLKYQKEYPTFQGMIRAYCTGLKKAYTPRHRWIWELDLFGGKPKHFPKNDSWAKYGEAMVNLVVPTVDAWVRGEIPDPYNGRAYHFGSETDPHLNRPLPHIRGFRNRYYKDQ